MEYDAGPDNIEDGCSSDGGQLIMLTGQRNKCCVSAWPSNKIKMVVKSNLAAKILSLLEALDHFMLLMHYTLLKQLMPGDFVQTYNNLQN